MFWFLYYIYTDPVLVLLLSYFMIPTHNIYCFQSSALFLVYLFIYFCFSVFSLSLIHLSLISDCACTALAIMSYMRLLVFVFYFLFYFEDFFFLFLTSVYLLFCCYTTCHHRFPRQIVLLDYSLLNSLRLDLFYTSVFGPKLNPRYTAPSLWSHIFTFHIFWHMGSTS